jgi:CBS domain-containing protein
VPNNRGEAAMKTIRQLLEAKGRDVWSVDPDASVFEALELMAEKEVGALLVVDGADVVGVFSERDYARKIFLKGRSSKETRVDEIMTARVVYAPPDQTIEECMALMTDKRIRHLPVMDEGRIVGVISIGDLVKAIIVEQKYIIEQMERYISG